MGFEGHVSTDVQHNNLRKRMRPLSQFGRPKLYSERLWQTPNRTDSVVYFPSDFLQKCCAFEASRVETLYHAIWSLWNSRGASKAMSAYI